MPPLESTGRSRQVTDVYSVMLLVASIFLLFALALTYIELSSDYKFMGTAEGESAEPAEEAGAEEETEGEAEGEAEE